MSFWYSTVNCNIISRYGVFLKYSGSDLVNYAEIIDEISIQRFNIR